MVGNPKDRFFCDVAHLSHDMTKPTKWVCAQWRQIRLGIRPVRSASSLCAQWIAKDPTFLHADSEDWSDWEDAQADLRLRWAHSHFVGFVLRQLILLYLLRICFVGLLTDDSNFYLIVFLLNYFTLQYWKSTANTARVLIRITSPRQF